MNITRNILGASALFLTASFTANASTLSLSGPASVNAGDSFQVTIEGDFSAGGLFAGGSLFGFDPSLVTLDNVTLDVTVDPGFSCPGTAASCATTANDTTVWWGSFTGVLPAGTAAPTQMATIDLTALAGANGTANFTLVEDLNAGGWFDANFAGDTPVFSGTSIDIVGTNPVPVPAAVWLFGSGLMGLVGVARRRKIA